MTIDTSHAEPGAEPSANPVADRATDADTIESGGGPGLRPAAR